MRPKVLCAEHDNSELVPVFGRDNFDSPSHFNLSRYKIILPPLRPILRIQQAEKTQTE